jgi:hypothetical protein
MSPERPVPGSPWATTCPDAYPIEWFDAEGLTALPPGFTRFATDEEAALITGKLCVEDFRSARSTPSVRPATSGARLKRKRADVGQRFRDLSAFLRGPHRDLTPTARAVWLCLYTFTENGRAIVTQAKMAEFGGVSVRSVKTAVRTLERCGLLEVLERGRPGRASVYRYRVSVTS